MTCSTFLRKYLFHVCIAFVLCSCSSPKEKSTSITLFAAASLNEVISELAQSFEKKTNTQIKINFASSGTLARQITQGASPDLYISANQNWIHYLDSLGLIIPHSNTNIARNELVLIGSTQQRMDSTTDFPSLLQNQQIAMGDPQHVPAGLYAKQALQSYSLYSILEKQITPTKDVRSALMLVELGEIPLGIVYRTDALKSPKVSILSSFPEHTHAPILYTAGLITNKKTAKEFITFLNSKQAIPIWVKHGFKK